MTEQSLFVNTGEHEYELHDLSPEAAMKKAQGELYNGKELVAGVSVVIRDKDGIVYSGSNP